MTILTPVEIFQVAVEAGFTPEQAEVFTAIALAESGGDPDINAAGSEDSRGLWQINARSHPTWAKLDLTDPLTNARAAYAISEQGTNIDPWSVTHAAIGRPYEQYLDEARSAAVAAGHLPATASYSKESATDAARVEETTAGPVVQPVDGVDPDDLYNSWGDPRRGNDHHEGMDILAPEGTPVRAIASGTVVKGFDDDLGGVVVRIQGDDGIYYYYAHLKEGSVDESMLGQHVGAGQVIGQVSNTGDAAGGVTHLHLGFYRDGVPFNPYDTVKTLPTYEEWADNGSVYRPEEGSEIEQADTDDDGLLDEFEVLLGTSLESADTDKDGLSDFYETTVSHTDPLASDTDHDTIPDSLEVAQGSDAGVAEIPEAALARGFGGGRSLDRDKDGVSDLREYELGSDATNADSDNDRVPDSMELALGSDLMSMDSNDDGVTDYAEYEAGRLGGDSPLGSAPDEDEPDSADPPGTVAVSAT